TRVRGIPTFLSRGMLLRAGLSAVSRRWPRQPHASRTRRRLPTGFGLAALLVATAPALRPAARPAAEQRITVVFRLDDVSARSDTALESGIVRVFRRHGMHCTLGVIPRIAGKSVYDSAPQD